MKKNNKKGFTLIELLAVIIILGVIMLIAIPSVTGQISASRKSSYAKSTQEFINSVIKIVNNGQLDVFDTDTLYAIPVGNNDALSCVQMESGGTSPYSPQYKYAYVFFTYDGNGYDYWVTAKDWTDQGIYLVKADEVGARNYNANGAVTDHGVGKLKEVKFLMQTYEGTATSYESLTAGKGTKCTKGASGWANDFADADSDKYESVCSLINSETIVGKDADGKFKEEAELSKLLDQKTKLRIFKQSDCATM
jgi:prepilin-type N-terminal cleavage/methylation domain-containing protein